MIDKTKLKLENLKDFFFSLENNSQEIENESEIFIYKHILESTSYLHEVWSQLMISIKKEYIQIMKVEQINIVI